MKLVQKILDLPIIRGFDVSRSRFDKMTANEYKASTVGKNAPDEKQVIAKSEYNRFEKQFKKAIKELLKAGESGMSNSVKLAGIGKPSESQIASVAFKRDFNKEATAEFHKIRSERDAEIGKMTVARLLEGIELVPGEGAQFVRGHFSSYDKRAIWLACKGKAISFGLVAVNAKGGAAMPRSRELADVVWQLSKRAEDTTAINASVEAWQKAIGETGTNALKGAGSPITNRRAKRQTKRQKEIAAYIAANERKETAEEKPKRKRATAKTTPKKKVAKTTARKRQSKAKAKVAKAS